MESIRPGRGLPVVIMAILALALVGGLAGADPGLPTTGNGEPAETQMEATPVIADIGGANAQYGFSVIATLTTEVEDEEGATSRVGVLGVEVKFVVGDKTVCIDITTQRGEARCGFLADAVETFANGGYTAVFEGNDDYAASSADAPVLLVGGTPIP